MPIKAKPRMNGELSNNKKSTRHFYIKNSTYDQLIRESAEKDIPISKLLEEKLQLLDKIKIEILKYNSGDNK